MCGISGIVSKNKIDIDILKKMTDTMLHRGPDDAGYEIISSKNLQAGLGQRRLSIIDLSPLGHQPMFNEDKTVWITFNGEIYNFKDLKEDLLVKGHTFYSQTDTEVIIHGYEEYGTDFFQRMNGMFAFAIWDVTEETLILGRDRYGKKPLYYAICDGDLIFSSELKALEVYPSFNHQLSLEALSLYLQFEYYPAPYTAYEKTFKLEAGHFLVWKNQEMLVKKWWDIKVLEEKKWLSCSETEIIKVLNEKLLKAVERRLISDVPLGVFLSGGIDSSIITALMTEIMPASQIKTFSIGFNEKSFNESNYAQIVANHLGTDHHVKILSPKDMPNILPEIIPLLDEPYADASIIPTYLLSKFTRESVTVALGGDGGDELFAGYDPFLADKIANLYDLIPQSITNKIIKPLAGKLPVSENNMSFDFKIKRFLRYVYQSPVKRNQLWLGAYDKDEQNLLFSDSVRNELKSFYPLDLINLPDYPDSVLAIAHHYQKYYLTDDILVKIDRAGMMASLEARTPFLDVEVAEFANSLPARYKLKGFTRKYILKKAFENKLPPEILYRKKKGFGIPLTKWIKEDLKKEIQEVFEPGLIKKQGLFNPVSVNEIFQRHLNGKADNRKMIWSLFMFQKWYQNGNRSH